MTLEIVSNQLVTQSGGENDEEVVEAKLDNKERFLVLEDVVQ